MCDLNLSTQMTQQRGNPRLIILVATLHYLGGFHYLISVHGRWTFAAEIPSVTADEVGLSKAKLAEVDQFMERQVRESKLAGGCVIIARNGRVGFFRTYGMRDKQNALPMLPDTIVRLYSMSKSITTAAALTLVDAGKLHLDAPVSKFIPSFGKVKVATQDGLRDPVRAITVRDLMLHTSGMTYGGTGPDLHKEAFARLKPFESNNLEEFCEKAAQIPLAHDPGADWTYSIATDVLGRIIEVASGEKLDSFLKKTLFEPLDMKDTSFVVPMEKISRFATNYRRSNDQLEVIDTPAESKYLKPAGFLSGGGGLVGTARDYLRFLVMIENRGELDGVRILKAETVSLMTTNQLNGKTFPIHFGKEIRYGTGFGLGFSVRTESTQWDPSGHVGEYGWGGAASTHYWCSPKDRLIVITLEQTMPYQWDTEFGLKKIIYDALSSTPQTRESRRSATAPLISPELKSDGSVTFRLRAPTAREVKVTGQFGPDTLLARDDDGVWSTTIPTVPAGIHEYRFIVDGLNILDPHNSFIKPQRWPGSSVLHVPSNPPSPWDLQQIPHGAVHEHTYRSLTLDRWRKLFVYTPPGEFAKEPLPVLYLSHGYSDNEATWTAHGKAHWIMDSLIASKQVVPMVIVMPDAHALTPGTSRFEEYGPANTEALCRELLQDIIPLVEQSYRVKSEPSGRAFAGLSMGGHHALSIAMNHHKTFSWIGAFSSAIPPYDSITQGLNQPESVNQNLKLLWIACGSDDFLLQRNVQFNALLKEKGIRHEYLVTDGNHSWPVWRRYLVDFTPKLFR